MQCEGFGSVQLVNCSLDPEAEAIFNIVRVQEGRRKYSIDDLRTDIQCVINKFIVRGEFVLKTVGDRNLTKGPISASRYRDEIVNVLCALVLERHHISGTSGGYHVREKAEAAVRFYAANNNFTGPLAEAFDKLKEKLPLK